MPEHDTDGPGPSLEAPRLGFRRRKGRETPAEPVQDAVQEAPAPPAASTEPPVVEATRETPPTQEVPAVEETRPVAAVVEPTPAPAPVDVPAAAAPVAPVAPEPPAHVPPADDPRPLFADEVDAPDAATALTPATVALATDEPTDADAAPAAPAPRAPRTWGLADRNGAIVSGALVGLLICGLTYLALQGCSAVRGTASCGGGPGFALLVAILIAAVIAGASLLRLSRVPDPGSTSFLAVGLLCVLSLLFLVDHLMDWWMVIVLPLLSAAMFAASYQVTTSFLDEDA